MLAFTNGFVALTLIHIRKHDLTRSSSSDTIGSEARARNRFCVTTGRWDVAGGSPLCIGGAFPRRSDDDAQKRF